MVVGAGSIGRRHLANLMRIPEVTERAVLDPDATRLQTVIRDDAAVRCHDHPSSAYADPPDVVLICTPTAHHAEQAVEALRRGAHTFIEKPIADSLPDAAEIEAEASKARVRVMVACNLRFHPAVALLKAELDSGVVGRLYSIRAAFGHYLPNWRPDQDYRKSYSASRSQGGGAILDCVHEIDYVRWLGGEVHQVVSIADRLGELQIDVEDAAAIIMRHESGVLSEIHVDYLRRDKRRSCELVCSLGTVLWESTGKRPERVLVRRYHAEKARWETLLDLPDYDPNEAYVLELRHFFESIRTGSPPALDAAGGVRVLELALQAREFAEKQKATT